AAGLRRSHGRARRPGLRPNPFRLASVRKAVLEEGNDTSPDRHPDASRPATLGSTPVGRRDASPIGAADRRPAPDEPQTDPSRPDRDQGTAPGSAEAVPPAQADPPGADQRRELLLPEADDQQDEDGHPPQGRRADPRRHRVVRPPRPEGPPRGRAQPARPQG